jgi:hypothetical protein
MKTDKIYFHCKNNEVDNNLIKAIEALPEEWLIIPHDAELDCLSLEDMIIIYPHDPKIRLFCMERIETREYRELSSLTIFKLDNFSYEVFNLNPIAFYNYILPKASELFGEYSNKIFMERKD